MAGQSARHPDESGFSLVEIVVSMFLLGVVAMAFLPLVARAATAAAATSEVVARVKALSRRERQVLDGLVAGQPNKLIARELNISEHTVKFHVSSVYAKLGVTNRAEAVSQGARRGLISL